MDCCCWSDDAAPRDAVLSIDTDSVTLAGAFLLGAILATVAVLRVVRALTHFFAGTERRRFGSPRRSDNRPPDDDT